MSANDPASKSKHCAPSISQALSRNRRETYTLLKSRIATPRLRLCLAVLLLPFLLAFAAPAQETILRVDVRLVSVFVNVTDRNGRRPRPRRFFRLRGWPPAEDRGLRAAVGVATEHHAGH